MRKPYNFDLTMEQREFLEKEAVKKDSLQTVLIDLLQTDLDSRRKRRGIWQVIADYPEEFKLKKCFVDFYEKAEGLPTANDFQEFAQNIKSRNYPESVLKYYQTCYQAKSLPDDWLFYDGSDSTILNLRWKLTKGTGFNLAVDDYFSNVGGYRLDDWGGIMNLLRSKKIISEIVMIFLDGMQILITYKLTVEGRLWVHELKKEYGCPVPKFFLDTQPGNAKKMLAKIAPIRQARSDKQCEYDRKKAGR